MSATAIDTFHDGPCTFQFDPFDPSTHCSDNNPCPGRKSTRAPITHAPAVEETPTLPAVEPKETAPVSSLTGSEKSTKRVRSMGRYEWERELWNCPDIPAAYKGVLTALSFFSDFETGRNARPGESLLQEVTCASRSTVNRALRYGREEGWLHRNWTGGGTKKDESGKRLADEYWLTIPRHGHGHELDDVKRRI